MNAVISYTAGFWEAAGQYVRTRYDGRSGGWLIADCRDASLPSIQISANARLIAAAPDLLEVAMAVLDNASMEMPPALINAAEAAVSKATAGDAA